MIKIENMETIGFEAAIRGMRNPMNSWDKSDSCINEDGEFVMGPVDEHLASILARAGDDHGKFARMIWICCDITAPLYWWKEFDTYKIGTQVDPYDDFEMRDPTVVTNSCSTMHKLCSKAITMDDFSIEDLYAIEEMKKEGEFFLNIPLYNFRHIVETCEYLRQKYIDTEDSIWWRQLIQILPSSYNQKRTVMMNFTTLNHMIQARSNHKLSEWRDFCAFMKANVGPARVIYGW